MNKNFTGILFGALFGMSLAGCSSINEEAGLRKAIETAYPKMQVESIAKTKYNGLYEVFMGGQIIYTDAKFSFLIADGHLIESKPNMTLLANGLSNFPGLISRRCLWSWPSQKSKGTVAEN